MADPTRATTPTAATAMSTGDEATTAGLISAVTAQTQRLVKNEMALAKLEMGAKAKQAGIGAGAFGAAGVLALYGGGLLLSTIVLALALVLDAWLAALIVTVVVFALAGIAALLGKKKLAAATPAAPQATIESVKADVDQVKEARQR